MAKPTCHSCVYAYWDRCLWMRTLMSGFPSRPFCANHPDSPGREREVPCGDVCRNYRPRPADPDLADGSVKRIVIPGGFIVYVDAADYEWISRYNWYLVGGGYAGRYEKRKLILMHREIMKPPKGKLVDHIHGNRIDNTRANLHVCTPAENSRNQAKHRRSSSRYFGVYYDKKKDKWQASIHLNGRNKFLGRFDTELEAARAYDRAAVEQSDESARLNFPDEWPPAKRRRIHAQAQKLAKKQTRAAKKGANMKRKERKTSRRGESSFARTSSPRRARRSRRRHEGPQPETNNSL